MTDRAVDRARPRRGRARVVGAGVIGLTTAFELADDGWDVAVVAAREPAATVSAVAAAVWYPYLVGPAGAVETWGAVARARFAALAEDPAVPVVRRRVHERYRDEVPAPAWRLAMPDPRPDDVDAPYTAGFSYDSWTADMPRYLAWLVDELGDRDVAIDVARLDDLEEAAGPGVDLVVDCAGLGARRLADDPTVHPVGGQVVLVDAPGVDAVWLDEDAPGGPAYVIPRTDTVVVGGTSVEGAAAGADPDPAVAAAIMDRATVLVPALAEAEVVGHAIGRRPARPDVRLELERRSWGPVIHHYGHGGAGMTLSWGSAAAAVELARGLG